MFEGQRPVTENTFFLTVKQEFSVKVQWFFQRICEGFVGEGPHVLFTCVGHYTHKIPLFGRKFNNVPRERKKRNIT